MTVPLITCRGNKSADITREGMQLKTRESRERRADADYRFEIDITTLSRRTVAITRIASKESRYEAAASVDRYHATVRSRPSSNVMVGE